MGLRITKLLVFLLLCVVSEVYGQHGGQFVRHQGFEWLSEDYQKKRLQDNKAGVYINVLQGVNKAPTTFAESVVAVNLGELCMQKLDVSKLLKYENIEVLCVVNDRCNGSKAEELFAENLALLSANLHRLPKLTHLKVTDPSDEFLKSVSTLSGLKVLRVDFRKRNAKLPVVASLRELVVIGNCSDLDLSGFAALEKLEVIGTAGSSYSLSACANLKALIFTGEKLSFPSEGAVLPALTDVEIRFATSINTKHIEFPMTLGTLPVLDNLKMRFLVPMRFDDNAKFVTPLKSLSIENLSSESISFPNFIEEIEGLETLSLVGFGGEFPKKIASISSIKKLELHYKDNNVPQLPRKLGKSSLEQVTLINRSFAMDYSKPLACPSLKWTKKIKGNLLINLGAGLSLGSDLQAILKRKHKTTLIVDISTFRKFKDQLRKVKHELKLVLTPSFKLENGMMIPDTLTPEELEKLNNDIPNLEIEVRVS